MKIDMRILDFFKLPMQSILAICITCGTVLLLPDNISNRLWLTSIKEKIGFVIGIVFVLSLAIILVSICYTFSKYIFEKYKNYKFMKGADDRIFKLDDRQKVILVVLLTSSNKTADLRINDGDVDYLEHMLMIRKTVDLAPQSLLSDIRFPYTFQPWVIDTIRKEGNEPIISSLEQAYKNYMSNDRSIDDWLYDYASRIAVNK